MAILHSSRIDETGIDPLTEDRLLIRIQWILRWHSKARSVTTQQLHDQTVLRISRDSGRSPIPSSKKGRPSREVESSFPLAGIRAMAIKTLFRQ